MTKDEAMKLALVRLQARTDTSDLDAIGALIEALAEQPAQQEPVAKPHEQEPVASASDDFLQGICVALQAVTGSGDSVLWREIVETAGADDLFQFAAHIEPEEWELAGFGAFAKSEMRRNKPKKLIAQPAQQEPSDTTRPQQEQHMKTVIEMAREAGISLCFRGHPDRPERTKNNELTYWAGVNQITLKAFTELVRADEREACAGIAEQHTAYDWAPAVCQITYAIRARGNK